MKDVHFHGSGSNVMSSFVLPQDINLDYCPQFGDEHLEILHSLTSLEKLSLRGSRVSGTGVSHFLHTLASRSVYGNQTALTTLDLSATTSKQARNINDGALESIAVSYPWLVATSSFFAAHSLTSSSHLRRPENLPTTTSSQA